MFILCYMIGCKKSHFSPQKGYHEWLEYCPRCGSKNTLEK